MIIDFKDTQTSLDAQALREEIKELGYKAHVITFGCQQNEADSEKMRGLLSDVGYTITDVEEDADVIIVNTCAIRRHAELKALSAIGRLKAYRKEKPHLIVGVVGCMAAEGHVVELLKKSFHFVTFTLQPGLIHKIPTLIREFYNKSKRTLQIENDLYDIIEGITPVRQKGHRAWVSIMYGCNNFCSYCIVPYVRGRERSRCSSDVIAECRQLVAQGCREITLLGQNVNSYKSDMDFATLISKIAEIEGDFILRFMTSNPKDVSDDLISALSKYKDKIAPHFHLPLQSGSDTVLKRMNRTYTREKYLTTVKKIRDAVPDIALSTDIIVGFPGETDADFEDTMSILSEVEFDMVYSFIYSVREGTVAARMVDQVPDDIKGVRMRRLIELSTESSKKKNLPLVGSTVKVLVDSWEEGTSSGRTLTNKLVRFVGDNENVGKFVNIKITKAGPAGFFGELIER